MAVNVNTTLRWALKELQAERNRIDQQIVAIRGVLNPRGQKRKAGATRRTRSRKQMSAAARKAVSRRMKAYWAKRRAGK